MNKNYFIFLTILIFLIICLPVQSREQRFDCKTNHKQFNRDAINLLHYNLKNSETGEMEDQLLLPEGFSETDLINELDAGNEDEDLTAFHFDIPFEVPIWGHTISGTRGHLHFLDFETKAGFNSPPLNFLSAYRWALGGDLIPAYNHNDYSWDDAIIYFKLGLYHWAYQDLGHVMHLLQDMGIPAHVRNDGHGPDIDWLNLIIGQRLGHDYFEEYCGSRNKSAYNSNLELATIYGETTQFKLQNLFYDLACVTGSRHYSDDSFWSGYSAPQYSVWGPYEEETVNNITYRYYLKNNKKLLVIKDNDFLHPYVKDDKVCKDYWEEISPNVISYSATLLKLFQDECFPYIKEITPEPGAKRTLVTITGKNFGEEQGSSTVKFDETLATEIYLWSDTQIICQVPLAITTTPFDANVAVKVDAARSNEKVYPIGIMSFVKVPGKNKENNKIYFQMGSPDDEGKPDEHPMNEVYLDSYEISKYEVTNRQFKQFVEAKPYTPQGDWRLTQYEITGYPDSEEYLNYPVVNVTWNDAKAFCNWLNESGINDTKQKYIYSLPTEAQWEKAARGTDGRIYPWGNAWDTGRCNNIAGPALTGMLNLDGSRGTVGVGLFNGYNNIGNGASPYYAMDMAGNVWEWCLDWYDEHYYQNSPKDNPTGPEGGHGKVLRGGGWGGTDNVSGSRCAARSSAQPALWDTGIGFRCVRKLR